MDWFPQTNTVFFSHSLSQTKCVLFSPLITSLPGLLWNSCPNTSDCPDSESPSSISIPLLCVSGELGTTALESGVSGVSGISCVVSGVSGVSGVSVSEFGVSGDESGVSVEESGVSIAERLFIFVDALRWQNAGEGKAKEAGSMWKRGR